MYIIVINKAKKKISVFRVTGLKILGRVGIHKFFNNFFFSGKNILLCILKGKYNFMHFERHFAFQNA